MSIRKIKRAGELRRSRVKCNTGYMIVIEAGIHDIVVQEAVRLD